MQRSLIVLAALTLVVSGYGCAKSTKKSNGQQVIAPAWSMTLKSKCTGNEETQCLAANGFSVSADGNFQAGPSPDGQVEKGQITKDELKELQAALEPILSSTQAMAEKHETLQAQVSSDDTLTLSKKGVPRVLIHNQGTELYFQLSSLEEAENLHNLIVTLARTYYSIPFPNPCIGATQSLSKLYASLQNCAADADCAYIGAGFAPVDAASSEWIITDDCSTVKPLFVGNAAQVRARQAELKEAQENTHNACGQALVRPECTGYTSFQMGQPGSQPPKCVNHVCQKVGAAPTFQ